MAFIDRSFTRILSLLILISYFASPKAQAQTTTKVGWYFSGSYSPMFHSDHIGHALGGEAGISLFKRKLQVGIIYYGRSGPINSQEYTYELPEGTEYKGQQAISLRADHGAFGLSITPVIPLAQNKLTLEIPLVFGQVGAGFYLTGDDRNTPDGRRVSEWENELLDNMDAGFGLLVEGGIRVATPIAKSGGIVAGVGLHYSQAQGWETTVGGTDFLNIPRASIFIRFGN